MRDPIETMDIGFVPNFVKGKYYSPEDGMIFMNDDPVTCPYSLEKCEQSCALFNVMNTEENKPDDTDDLVYIVLCRFEGWFKVG